MLILDVDPRRVGLVHTANDLTLFDKEVDHKNLTIRGWKTSKDHRISRVEFDLESGRVIINKLDRFGLSVEEVASMQNLLSRASTNSRIDKNLRSSDIANNFQCLITMYGLYKRSNTYKCLGFLALEDQINFAKAYCNLKKLDKFTDEVQKNNTFALSLIQFIIKLHNNLLLNGYSREEIARCSNIVLYEQFSRSTDITEGMQRIRNITNTMNSEVQELPGSVKNITEARSNSTAPHSREKRYIMVPWGFGSIDMALFRVFGIHRKILLASKKYDIMEVSLEKEILPEGLEQPSVSNITSQSTENKPLSKPIDGEKFLGKAQASAAESSNVFEERSSASTTKLPSEIESQKRSKNKSSVYKENIPSSSSKLESWINAAVNYFTNTIVAAAQGISQFISSPLKPALPSRSEQKKGFQSSDEKRKPSSKPSSEFREQFSVKRCAQNNIAAFNLLLKTVLNRKCPLPQARETTFEEAQAYSIDITAKSEQISKRTALNYGISVQNLNSNRAEIQLTVRTQALNNERGKVLDTLCSSVEKACPKFKQTGEFLAQLRSQLEKMLSEKEVELLAEEQKSIDGSSSNKSVGNETAGIDKPYTCLNGICMSYKPQLRISQRSKA
ncbi:MAG: hypothetical protein PG981_001377 [Wolbachia endosymbiont of Ctenocephalides orientis wCori]|nr:MAG: hypothetical protein PG981_001377 [Wolbachia endosymbiont of Ctenocephalides orientis wCori]